MGDLQSFRRRYPARAWGLEQWGPSRLAVSSHLCATLPPLDLVTSVRAVVFTGTEVLLARNRDEHHILPGGRREPGESLEETVRREVLEETGWLIDNLQLLGIMHFHHLLPRPPGFPYRYPDFLHVIYRAAPRQHVPERRVADDYELEATLVPLQAVAQISLPATQLVFLDFLQDKPGEMGDGL